MLPFSTEEFVHTYIDGIYRFVYRMTADQALSADITQEVCIKCWQKSTLYNPEKSSPKTWIYTLTYRTTLDYLKKNKVRHTHEIHESDFEDEVTIDDVFADIEPLPDELFAQKEIQEMVQNALQHLSGEEKLIVSMYHESNMTFKDIADILEKPLNTVKSKYRRSLITLRNILAPKQNP